MIALNPFSDRSDPFSLLTGDASVPPGDPKPDATAAAELAWRSPADNADTGCLQVAVADDDGVFIRDSADTGTVLAFTRAEFTAFCNAVCDGRYRDILPRIV